MTKVMKDGGISHGATRRGRSYMAQVRVYATDSVHGLICHTFDCGRCRTRDAALSRARECVRLVVKEANIDTPRKLERAAVMALAMKRKRMSSIPDRDDWHDGKRIAAGIIDRLAA